MRTLRKRNSIRYQLCLRPGFFTSSARTTWGLINNLVYLSTYFRGKVVSLQDLLNMDISYVVTLNRIAYMQRQDEEARQRRQNQEVEDAVQDEL